MKWAGLGKTQQVGHLTQRQLAISDIAQRQLAPHLLDQSGKAAAFFVQAPLQAALAEVQALRNIAQRGRPPDPGSLQ